MLNSILKKLNGHATDVDGLIAAVADLGQARDAARSELSELQVRRHQALLDDASDQTLDKLEREIERKETTLEKLELAEPGLRERIAAAKHAARQRRWNDLLKVYRAAVNEYLVAARTAIEKHVELAAIVERAQRDGFEREVAAHMPPNPNINGNALLGPELLDTWERVVSPPPASERRAAAAAQKPTGKPGVLTWRPGDEKWVTLAPDTSLQHAISSALPPSGSLGFMTARRAPDDAAPLNPGEVRVMALHSGWSPRDDAPQTFAGQRLRMPEDLAKAAANRGQVEILESYTPLPPSTEQTNEGLAK